ncbi:peroxidasin [Magallana gigas]|uniref:peroxidasin n=1 Tax=Magallana gigas TaxID=29159 RepID=UPI003341896C
MGLKKLDKRLLNRLPILKVLDLHGNKLKQLDWSFTKTPTNLAYIDISGNIFTELSNSSIMTLPHINSIHLNDNDWKCTCALEWVKVLPSPIPESVTCSTPESLQYMSIVNVPSSQLTCVPASVSCTSTSSTGKYHSSLNISCTFGGDPFPDVIWTKPDKTELRHYNYDYPNYEVSETGVLTIKSLDVDDNGQWTIQANNVKKQNKVNMQLIVTDVPTTTTITTTSTTTMSTISTTTNNNTTRKTIPPTTKTTTPTTTTEKTTIVKQTPAKKIAPVLSTGNNLKMTSKTVEGRLTELYLAEMSLKKLDKRLLDHLPILKVLDLHGNKLKRTGKYHSSLNISCTFGGDPFPDVIWTKPDGTELKYYNYDNPNYEVSETGVLTIKSLDVDDDGQWTVQANNVKKQNVVNIQVTVTDIPTTTTPITPTTTMTATQTTAPAENQTTSKPMGGMSIYITVAVVVGIALIILMICLIIYCIKPAFWKQNRCHAFPKRSERIGT